MQLLDRRTEEGVTLLTKLAYGDVALVRAALIEHGEEKVEVVIRYIRDHRNPDRRPASPRSPHPSAKPDTFKTD